MDKMTKAKCDTICVSTFSTFSTFTNKCMALLSQGCWELFSETGLSPTKALVLLLPFHPSSSASLPFQLFGSLPGNPNSPTCESRRKARAKHRECCVSLVFPQCQPPFCLPQETPNYTSITSLCDPSLPPQDQI